MSCGSFSSRTEMRPRTMTALFSRSSEPQVSMTFWKAIISIVPVSSSSWT